VTVLRVEKVRMQGPLFTVPFQVFTTPDGTYWPEFHRHSGRYLLRFPDVADFEVSRDGLEAVLHPAPGAPNDTIEHLYLNQVRPLMQSKSGALVLHASAIETAYGAIAFAGDSGRGKSTLAAAFARDGHRFLTDDGLVVEPVRGGHVALPSHPSLRLWDDSEAALMPPNVESTSVAHYTSKARFLAGKDLPFCTEPKRLRRVYFLGDGSVRDTTIRRLNGAETMVESVKHSFLLDVEEKPRLASHFRQVATLAKEPIHFMLDFPRRFEALPGVRRAVLEHVRISHD
jgi:hypothetical protein